jgi:bifunctional non-homologous end joining protein LigD
MSCRYVIHQHRTGRVHFDLRIVLDGILRSWSLLKEPPRRYGERRLAIERESFPIQSIESKSFEEEAFGSGRVAVWDEGDVAVGTVSPRLIALKFTGNRISGGYELRRMHWYPGTHWLMTKTRTTEKLEKNSSDGKPPQ